MYLFHHLNTYLSDTFILVHNIVMSQINAGNNTLECLNQLYITLPEITHQGVTLARKTICWCYIQPQALSQQLYNLRGVRQFFQVTDQIDDLVYFTGREGFDGAG